MARISWNKGISTKALGKSRKQVLYLDYNCLNCGNIFKAYPSEKRKYCSESCRSIYTKSGLIFLGKKLSEEHKKKLSISHMGINLGEKHPNWKGGIRGIDYLERRRFRELLQKQIFERDDYTCQMCGIRGVDLQVDHIQPWAEYVEMRFNINNCRTLCAKCHYLITFGKPMPKEIKAWGHNLLGGGLQ